MRKYFESGSAFILVGILCLAAGVIQLATGASSAGLIWLAVGGFWLVVAIVVRSRAGTRDRNPDSVSDGTRE